LKEALSFQMLTNKSLRFDLFLPEVSCSTCAMSKLREEGVENQTSSYAAESEQSFFQAT